MKLTRRLFLLIPTLVVPAKAQVADAEFLERCMNHERPWNRFIRLAYGCPSPAGPTTPETCKSGTARLDIKSFNEAGKAAKRLWPNLWQEDHR